MQTVDYPNLAPSVCIVCESVPPETPFVDTLRTFDPGGYTHLNGRKYLCENCVKEAADAVGLLDEVVAPVQAQVDELSAQVAQQAADIENFQTVKDALDQLNNRPVVQTEPVVAQAVETAKEKKAARVAAATKAQEDRAAAAEAEAEGAARQVAQEKAADDARAAAVAEAAAQAAQKEADDAAAAAAAAEAEVAKDGTDGQSGDTPTATNDTPPTDAPPQA